MLRFVFIFLQYIVDCFWGSRSRADELRAVRRHIADSDARKMASAEEAASAMRLRMLRETLGARVGAVVACGDCVRPRSLEWPGGQCCTGQTEALFTEDESASLKLSGTTSRHLKTRRLGGFDGGRHQGCVFRGPRGCDLLLSHRPSLCVRYMCFELQRELDLREDREETNRLQAEIRREFDAFVHHRKARREVASFEALRSSVCGRKKWGWFSF